MPRREDFEDTGIGLFAYRIGKMAWLEARVREARERLEIYTSLYPKDHPAVQVDIAWIAATAELEKQT